MGSLVLLVIAFHFISPGECTDCPGTEQHLDSGNIHLFNGCEHVTGNLIINNHSINSALSISHNQLFLLESILEIDGYLSIEGLNHTSIRNLRFLKRLQVIRGTETRLFYGTQNHSLVIRNNLHLRTLNLASLRRIERGGIHISENPALCLVDTISVGMYLINSNLIRVSGLAYDCSDTYCHQQCRQEDGCWGTLADECVTCRHYRFMGLCVSSCNLSLSYPDEDSMVCMPLTPPTTSPATPLTPTVDRGTQTPPNISNQSLFTTTFHTARLSKTKEVQVASLSTAGGLILIAIVIIVTLTAVLGYQQSKKRKKSRLPLWRGGTSLENINSVGQVARSNSDMLSDATEDNSNRESNISARNYTSTECFNRSSKNRSSNESSENRSSKNRSSDDRSSNDRSSTIKRGGFSMSLLLLGSRFNNEHESRLPSDSRTGPSPGSHDIHMTASSSNVSQQGQSTENVQYGSHSKFLHRDPPRSAENRSESSMQNYLPLYNATPHGNGESSIKDYNNLHSSSSEEGECSSSNSSSHDATSPYLFGGDAYTESNSDIMELRNPLFAVGHTTGKPFHSVTSGLGTHHNPLMMGGVYSTGHAHHHHRSHGNSHRGSLASSHGTGSSTRTSTRTISGTSTNQFGTSTSIGSTSAVFEEGI